MQRFTRDPPTGLPPVLNHYVTDRQRSVVAAFREPVEPPSLCEIVKRIEAQESQKPGVNGRDDPFDHDLLLPQEGSVLVLGSPESREALSRFWTPLRGPCPASRRRFTIDGTPTTDRDRRFGELSSTGSSGQRRDVALCCLTAGRNDRRAVAIFLRMEQLCRL